MEKFEVFTVLIAKISHAIRKIKTGEMSGFDLKSSHVSCLYYLYIKGPLTAKELVEISSEDKASLSRSLEYLQETGMIETGDKKRYKTPLVLTEKGRAVAKLIADKVDAVVAEVGKGMTEEERLVFYRCLTSICDNLQAISKKYD